MPALSLRYDAEDCRKRRPRGLCANAHAAFAVVCSATRRYVPAPRLNLWHHLNSTFRFKAINFIKLLLCPRAHCICGLHAAGGVLTAGHARRTECGMQVGTLRLPHRRCSASDGMRRKWRVTVCRAQQHVHRSVRRHWPSKRPRAPTPLLGVLRPLRVQAQTGTAHNQNVLNFS